MLNNKENTEVKSQDATLLADLAEAILQKRHAEMNFNNAEDEFINVAIYQYNAAQEKINVIIKKMKKEGIEYGNIINL
jgi:hypothetical protein